MTVTSLLVAKTTDEAVEAMAEGARPVAGGTDLVATFALHRLIISSRLSSMNSWSMDHPERH